jgi:tetratricopeptide (TPR) repeat protein
MNLPVFLMGFANDKEGTFLRSIARERDAIDQAFQNRKHMCDFQTISDLNIENLIEKIRNVQPTIFHYGGHAVEDQLKFNAETGISAEKLAPMLAFDSNIELVFLNGCATYQQAQAFLQHGVRHVIATNTLINDEVAAKFAYEFYHSIGRGLPVDKAFAWAEATVNSWVSSHTTTRGFLKQEAKDPDELPWQLFNAPDREPWKWEEPQLQAWGIVKDDKQIGLPGVAVRKGRELKGHSDEGGYFDLPIRQSLVGKRFEIRVEKPHYMVVNEADLHVFPEVGADPDKELVEIIMCPADKWETYRNAYLNQNFTHHLNKGADHKKISTEQREQAVAQISNVVKQLEKVDLSKAKDHYIQAVQFMERGEFAEAIKVIREDELEIELADIERQQKELREQKAMVIESLFLKASAYLMNFEFAQAEACYDKILEIDPQNPENRLKYLNYLYRQNHLSSALEKCSIGLDSIDSQQSQWDQTRGDFLHEKGRILLKLNDVAGAKQCFEQALGMRSEIVNQRKKLKQEQNAELQSILDSLVGTLAPGSAYEKKEAEVQFSQVLKLKDQIKSLNLAGAEAQMAATLNNLGNLYRLQREFKKGEELLLQSLKIDENLVAQNEAGAIPFVAVNLHDLGQLYAYSNQHAKAEEKYLASLKIREELARENPLRYQPDVAETLLNLGKFHSYKKRNTKALEYYQKALVIQKDLARKNPAAYTPDLSATYHNLGRLYQRLKKYDQALENYQLALSMRKEMMEGNPDAYMDEYAATLTNLGIFHKLRENYPKAEQCLQEALKLDLQLVKKDERTYEPFYGMCLFQTSLLYSKMREKDKTLATIEKALKVFAGLEEEDISWLDVKRYKKALEDMQTKLKS